MPITGCGAESGLLESLHIYFFQGAGMSDAPRRLRASVWLMPANAEGAVRRSQKCTLNRTEPNLRSTRLSCVYSPRTHSALGTRRLLEEASSMVVSMLVKPRFPTWRRMTPRQEGVPMVETFWCELACHDELEVAAPSRHAAGPPQHEWLLLQLVARPDEAAASALSRRAVSPPCKSCNTAGERTAVPRRTCRLNPPVARSEDVAARYGGTTRRTAQQRGHSDPCLGGDTCTLPRSAKSGACATRRGGSAVSSHCGTTPCARWVVRDPPPPRMSCKSGSCAPRLAGGAIPTHGGPPRCTARGGAFAHPLPLRHHPDTVHNYVGTRSRVLAVTCARTSLSLLVLGNRKSDGLRASTRRQHLPDTLRDNCVLGSACTHPLLSRSATEVGA
ncbi:hypothetical protein GGX14DRAFT_406824 [Mycena pura]|uniref:Uncharacterized protein n=1 Tax=Mycena pura TaxID=153505 RepID=A0AAD6Y171_9AGAR|nr:hypothetical protein GGX14DRAFT_406824 [Mycena pura]